MRKYLAMTCMMLLAAVAGHAQDLTGIICGKIYDAVTGEPLEFAGVSVDGDAMLSTQTDLDGYFEVNGVPVGRHNVKVVYLGYEPLAKNDIVVGSAHAVTLDMPMTPQATQLQEVVVRQDVGRTNNTMALTGGIKLDMAEASRYAGSLDDPGRLASTVAGTSADVSHNGMSIHGIAPHLMQWRLEGIEIPNPNHYADIATLGGGVLSSLSSFVLGNSDFYAGASPAQYANALSGVFDMRMRNGSDRNYQHALQVGALGIDLASEGPIGAKGKASYIVDYRYSATGLLGSLGLLDAGGVFNYQDLNFKVNMPTNKAGDFSVWGTMLIDKFKDEPGDPSEWVYIDDGTVSSTDQSMIAVGANHRIRLGNGRLTTSLAFIRSNNAAAMSMAKSPTHFPGQQDKFYPYMDVDKHQTDLVASLNWLTSPTTGWRMNIGATFTEKIYRLDMFKAHHIGDDLQSITDGDGSTSLVEAYIDNVWRLSDNFQLGGGANMMLLTLNNTWSVQPRLSMKWRPSSVVTLTAGAGMYSRMENMDVYFSHSLINTLGTAPDVNHNLGFTKSVHATVGTEVALGSKFRLSVSPFYNYLYDVPCGVDDSYSILNVTDFYIDRQLVNKGKGKSYGVDLTFERNLADGWYGNFTASLFKSTYCGGDGVWRDTRFDRGYILNLLGGKEWKVGSRKNNMLGINGRLTFQGGERYTPIDVDLTAAHADHQIFYLNSKAYSLQHEPMFLVSFSASYRINRKSVSHVFAVDVLNVGGYNEPIGFAYNPMTYSIDVLRQKTALPNIFYRLEF